MYLGLIGFVLKSDIIHTDKGLINYPHNLQLASPNMTCIYSNSIRPRSLEDLVTTIETNFIFKDIKEHFGPRKPDKINPIKLDVWRWWKSLKIWVQMILIMVLAVSFAIICNCIILKI